MSDSKFSLDDLEGRSYRDLQQLAKSLGLPSNVKKVYLIQLIHAKKYKSPAEVELIVQRVKLERQQFSKVRKSTSRRRINLQANEIFSSNSSSPPIRTTPKKSGHIVIQSSPNNRQTIMKYQRPTLLRPTYAKRTYPPMKSVDRSDRVLRSFNLKSQTSQASLNGQILKVIKSQNGLHMRPAITQRHTSISKETRIDLENQDSHYCKVEISSKCVGTQHKACVQKPHFNVMSNLPRPQLTVPNRLNLMTTLPAKRQRMLSGIYPLMNKEPAPKVNYSCIQSIGFRHSDGKISKINALVQKSKEPNTNIRNIDLTVQDLINSNIDSQNMRSEYSIQDNIPLQYPNTTNVYVSSSDQRQFNYFDANDIYKENECNQSSVYYHKKIRGEQIRRMSVQKDLRNVGDERLPRINEVFSKFNVVNRDVMQPIYVQVSEESERILNYPIFVSKASSTNMLEPLYNFKSQFLMSQPLLQMATTAATKCVYSTPVIATPVAQASTTNNDPYCVSPCERDSQYSNETEIPRIYDFLAMTEQEMGARRCCANDSIEDFNTSTSSLERPNSQATIPEMVEDALEIISQDGDYMERIGMDVRMQCILCSWAGPRIILEYHIRKDHPNQIHKQDKSEWNITYTLGSLVQQPLWASQVIEYGPALYVLSAKYEDPDYFMATLTMLSIESEAKSGTITVYNKVTGQPYSWTGNIEILPPSLPYYADSVCLKLEISTLNLIPNSANLKLLNRELVIKSPNKVIVGHPELNDIHIILFVRIF